MNSQDYIEVIIKLFPFDETFAEILEAQISDLPYDSFVIENEILKCYILKELFVEKDLQGVLKGVGYSGNITYSYTEIPFENWNEIWENEGFTPIIIGKELTVKSWKDKNQLPKTQYNILLHPQMAFGTGHHRTTLMMMKKILENRNIVAGNRIADIGCGTAVLSILAAKLGAEKVLGVDIDYVAAQSARFNIALNKVTKKINIECGTATLLEKNKYRIILANIHKNIIINDLDAYSYALEDGGILLCSGFYKSDLCEIEKEANKRGFRLTNAIFDNSDKQISDENRWTCLEFQK